jgi:hypothetical protein
MVAIVIPALIIVVTVIIISIIVAFVNIILFYFNNYSFLPAIFFIITLPHTFCINPCIFLPILLFFFPNKFNSVIFLHITKP